MAGGDSASRAGETVEIAGPPRFGIGDKVRCRREIRSDGTITGIPRGEVFLLPGEVGYVADIGEHLQRYYVYAVDYVRIGRIVGMRSQELEAVGEQP